MYPEDSIICCLFPNNCNMFPRTPLMTFLDTYGLSSNPWQSTWLSNSLYMIIFIIFLLVVKLNKIKIKHFKLIFLNFQKCVSKLIVHNDSSEENCIQELSLQKKVLTECIDNNLIFNENNSESNEAMTVSRVGHDEPGPVGCLVRSLRNKPIPCALEEVSNIF